MKYLMFFVLAAASLLLPGIVSAHPGDGFSNAEHISNYDVRVSIRPDGKVEVGEVIGYDFASLIRHGIFRDFFYIKTNDAGKKFAIDVSDVSVVNEDNAPYMFSQTTEGDTIQWKIGDPDTTITGSHTYQINYTAAGALTYFPGHDELYWNAIGNAWDVPVAKASVFVSIPPGKVDPTDIHVDCFTGVSGSTEKNCTAAVVDSQGVKVTTTKALQPNEGLTVVVGFPKGLAAVLEPRELVPFFDTLAGKIVLILIAVAAFFWYIVAPVVVIRKWWTGGRDPKPAMGEVAAWFSPPQNKHHRALTPAETGTLIDERADLRDIYASIVDLARRGYLKIIETKKNNFDLAKMKDWEGQHDVRPFEIELLNGIFSGGDTVSVKDLDLTKTLEKVKTMLYESLVDEKFFPSNPNTLRGWYIALAVLSLIIFNPVLLLVSLIFGQHMPRKTLFGSEQAAVARSLKNFLASQDKQLAFQAKNQMMFEKLLAFAVAFGVEEIWAGRFKGLGIKNPDWYQSSSGTRFNSMVFAHSLGSGMSRSFAASIAAHSSSGHSSGFSSGGGFSGGGGGGGGGGSW
ncbi:DUF2207 domain-containing protein [Candidatus Gottesmanbacteria bacterium]|nr:DUF2207 domain-containing protein [Candidatus Gottesmanbacteria bacterium]